MAVAYYDRDADLADLRGETVAVIGYGNQGRAQALNLRDSGVSVVVGCPGGSYRQAALQDGQVTSDIAEAVEASDLVILLIPDEVQKQVYRESIEPHLKPGIVSSAGPARVIQFGLKFNW